jgi:hypothetical protein
MSARFRDPVLGREFVDESGVRMEAKLHKYRPVTKQAVRQMIKGNLEQKFFDSKEYAQSATVTPTQLAISAMPQGDTDNARDGDAVNLVKLWFKFECYLQGIGGTNDFTDQVRLIFYQWHPMSTGAAPVPANVLIDLSVAQSPTMSAYQWDNRKDFKILYDRTFNLSGNGPSDIGTMGTINLKNVQSHFSNGSSTLGTNQIFAMISSDSLVATHPQFNLYTRVIYTDA